MLIGRDAWLTLVLLGGLMGSGLWDQQLQAGDWPQILGPTRNGQAVQERLEPAYFKASPRVNWQHDLGAGFASWGSVAEGSSSVPGARSWPPGLVRARRGRLTGR